ncbi:hypothetical protein J5224_30290, partial [Candidatus Symbiopectobacterium sp. NZEC135]|nr:hypothetical protein [Candidatus Symbiopectobacterium sp. NZEC135]
GRIDFYLGIATPEISMNEFFIENAIKTEFCIMARHGHPLAGSTALSQLQGCKWYFPNARTGYYKELEKHIFPNGKQADSRIIYGDSMTIGEQLVTNEDYLFIGPKAILIDRSCQRNAACCRVYADLQTAVGANPLG